MENDVITQEIDLMSLIGMLFRRWYIIFLAVILALGAAYVYAYKVLDSTYDANASMIILVSNEEQTAEQNYNFSSKLTKTYSELAKSDLVILRVIDELNLNISETNLRNSIEISGVQDTIIIKLKVSSHHPEQSSMIANKTVEVMQDVSKDFEGFDNIEVLDSARTPVRASGPNRLLYVAIGVILGGIVGVGIIFVLEMIDKTIKTSKDIEQKLQLRVLASIPEYEIPEELEHV